jgi:DNA-directed RNA polymerase sigma subunit (sigma70/sigma32)
MKRQHPSDIRPRYCKQLKAESDKETKPIRTTREVAAMLGVTNQRVTQIETKAFAKIAKAMKELEDWAKEAA